MGWPVRPRSSFDWWPLWPFPSAKTVQPQPGFPKVQAVDDQLRQPRVLQPDGAACGRRESTLHGDECLAVARVGQREEQGHGKRAVGLPMGELSVIEGRGDIHIGGVWGGRA